MRYDGQSTAPALLFSPVPTVTSAMIDIRYYLLADLAGSGLWRRRRRSHCMPPQSEAAPNIIIWLPRLGSNQRPTD